MAPLYLIVVPFELPLAVHWPKWRRLDWQPRLGPDERRLDEHTLFVTPTDLEVASVVLVSERAAGRPTSFRALVAAWRDDWREAHMVRSATSERMELRTGLGEFLRERHHPLALHASPVIKAASDQAFDVLLRDLFPEASIEEARRRRGAGGADGPA